MQENELITAQELAAILCLSVDTIWRYTREKKIPFVEIGNRQYRYHKQSVLRALAGKAAVAEDSSRYEGKKKLTYEDYASLPEDPGFRYEVIDGVLLRDPSPSFQHQRVSRRLQRILEDYFAVVDPKGEVFNAPLDLTLAEYNVVQPDLLYLPGSSPAQATPIKTVPELVVEVLSPSTSRKDRVLKLNHYQAAGVLHYWILDPENCFIEAYELRDEHYVSMVRAGKGTFTHPSFPGLTFEFEALFGQPS
ncbi:MAG TPA: Uma2 family endonuclease [Oscillospiraceae bacterium]|nr:Uma2 family endonuclease [Oscillospiraceae bacterium]